MIRLRSHLPSYVRQNAPMHVSAKSDYAMRALVELASAQENAPGKWVSSESIAEHQGISVKFLEGIMRDLRQADLVISQRGSDGGYQLNRPATGISVADAVRAVDGPLAAVRGERPEDLLYPSPAAGLRNVWVALRASMRDVLEQVTVSQVLHDDFPPHIKDLLSAPDAWHRRERHSPSSLNQPSRE